MGMSDWSSDVCSSDLAAQAAAPATAVRPNSVRWLGRRTGTQSARRPRSRRSSKSDPANGHGAVGAAKTEGIGNRQVDLHVPRLVGAVVAVAFGVLVEDVAGGRRLLVVQGQGVEQDLNGVVGGKRLI